MSTSMVDTAGKPKAAFTRGFWRGMAAPLLLYSSFELPPQALPMEFAPLALSDDGRASDWVKVGNDLREAAKKRRQSDGRG